MRVLFKYDYDCVPAGSKGRVVPSQAALQAGCVEVLLDHHNPQLCIYSNTMWIDADEAVTYLLPCCSKTQAVVTTVRRILMLWLL